MSASIHAQVFNEPGLRPDLVELQPKLLRGYLTDLLKYCLLRCQPPSSLGRNLRRQRSTYKVSDRDTAFGEADCDARVRERDEAPASDQRDQCHEDGGNATGGAPGRSAREEPGKESDTAEPQKGLINGRRRDESRNNRVSVPQRCPQRSSPAPRKHRFEFRPRAERSRREPSDFENVVSHLEEASRGWAPSGFAWQPGNDQPCEVRNGADLRAFRVGQGHLEVILDLQDQLDAVQAHETILAELRPNDRTEAAR